MSPEVAIWTRTETVIKNLAAAGTFVASRGELIRRVDPIAVGTWRTSSEKRGTHGVFGIALPSIRITLLGTDSQMGAGLNCADDEAVRIVVQVLDDAPYSEPAPIVTYSDWMKAIRSAILTVPNPFQQDADVSVYDPYVVHVIRRLPAEEQSLVKHDQQVAMLVFQVMVRHHR